MSGIRAAALAALVGGLAGCAGKLDVERTYDQSGLDRNSINLPAQPRAQTLTVTVTTDNPVDVFVLPAAAGDPTTIEAAALPKKATAHKAKMSTGSFTADIPAGQETNVLVTPAAGSPKAKVTIKLTN
jgi:hypothetical protein